MAALSDRKKRILRSLVDDYIASASPVSSKDIQEKHLSDFSSATIRNEMSALESMGYLVQPHTSAGRVPSNKAFRFYVDQLMEAAPLDEYEIELIREHFGKSLTGIREIMESAAKVLAKVTRYPSVAVGEVSGKELLKNILPVRVSDDKALVLIVTDAHVFKDAHIDIAGDVTDQSLADAGKWLNKLFVNKTIDELRSVKKTGLLLNAELLRFQKLFDDVLDLLVKVSERKREVFAEGGSQMLQYPEYSDVERAKQFLTVIENKDGLAELIDDNNLEMSIKIGKEDDENVPEGCALVTAKFSGVGNAAVIGPVRMDYRKVVSVMEHIGKVIESIISGRE